MDFICAFCNSHESRPMPNAREQLCTNCTRLKSYEAISGEGRREGPILPVGQRRSENEIVSPTPWLKSIRASDIPEELQLVAPEPSGCLETLLEGPLPEYRVATRSMRSLMSEKDCLTDGETDAIDTGLLSAAIAEVTVKDADNSREKDSNDSKLDRNRGNSVKDESCLANKDETTPDAGKEAKATTRRKRSTRGCSTPKTKKSSTVEQDLCAECFQKSIQRRRSLRPRPERQEIKEKPIRKGKSWSEPNAQKLTSKKKSPVSRTSQLSIFVKAEYISGESSCIRRFPIIGNLSYTSLQQTLAKLFSIPETCTLEYGDNEGDLVIISTDDEVNEMCRVVSAHDLSPVRIRITEGHA